MSSHNRSRKTLWDILPAGVISVVGGFVIAAVLATIAGFDYSNGYLHRGSGMAIMSLPIATIPLAGFLIDYFRSGK